jgi:adenosine/AMP kinase
VEVRLLKIPVRIPEKANVIIGRSHFIKTVEDIYETLVTTVPGIKFGLAFNEASGKRLVRYEGNDEELVKAAIETALN